MTDFERVKAELNILGTLGKQGISYFFSDELRVGQNRSRPQFPVLSETHFSRTHVLKFLNSVMEKIQIRVDQGILSILGKQGIPHFFSDELSYGQNPSLSGFSLFQDCDLKKYLFLFFEKQKQIFMQTSYIRPANPLFMRVYRGHIHNFFSSRHGSGQNRGRPQFPVFSEAHFLRTHVLKFLNSVMEKIQIRGNLDILSTLGKQDISHFFSDEHSSGQNRGRPQFPVFSEAHFSRTHILKFLNSVMEKIQIRGELAF